MNASIRKQVYELTPNDLIAFPAWEFAIDEEDVDGQDEATVRPFSVGDAIDVYDGSLVIAAIFVLADGSQFTGYLTPRLSEDANPDSIQPQIVTPSGQVVFWCGVCEPQIERSYKLLGRNANDVFPIRFSSTVPLKYGTISGEIPGFLRLGDDFKTVTVLK